MSAKALADYEAKRAAAEPEAIPLDILYEDEDLLVLNKPAGLVVHPAPGNWSGTLLNGLLALATVLPVWSAHPVVVFASGCAGLIRQGDARFAAGRYEEAVALYERALGGEGRVEQRQGGTPGEFEFYVLALTWSPGFCAGAGCISRWICAASSAKWCCSSKGRISLSLLAVSTRQPKLGRPSRMRRRSSVSARATRSKGYGALLPDMRGRARGLQVMVGCMVATSLSMAPANFGLSSGPPPSCGRGSRTSRAARTWRG